MKSPRITLEVISHVRMLLKKIRRFERDHPALNRSDFVELKDTLRELLCEFGGESTEIALPCDMQVCDFCHQYFREIVESIR